MLNIVWVSAELLLWIILLHCIVFMVFTDTKSYSDKWYKFFTSSLCWYIIESTISIILTLVLVRNKQPEMTFWFCFFCSAVLTRRDWNRSD